jgi:hypothetical protein
MNIHMCLYLDRFVDSHHTILPHLPSHHPPPVLHSSSSYPTSYDAKPHASPPTQVSARPDPPSPRCGPLHRCCGLRTTQSRTARQQVLTHSCKRFSIYLFYLVGILLAVCWSVIPSLLYHLLSYLILPDLFLSHCAFSTSSAP